MKILKEIKLVFPKEPLEVYYKATVRKNDSGIGKTVLGKGKLLHKAKNLIHLGGYARPTKKRKRTFESEEPENNAKKQEIGKYASFQNF